MLSDSESESVKDHEIIKAIKHFILKVSDISDSYELPLTKEALRYFPVNECSLSAN